MWDFYLIPICFLLALTADYGALVTLQLNNYYHRRFELKSLIPYALSAAFAVVCTVTVLFSSLGGAIVFGVIGGAALTYFTIRNVKRRTHYKFTHRAIRLFTLYVLLTGGAIVAAGLLCQSEAASYAATILSMGLSTWLLDVAAAVLMPFERARNRRYIDKTRRYLASLPIITIGITGSYGKTSCKNVLAAMLSARYTVIKTEKNYNTPLGICKTAEKYGGERIFIAEMGAKRRGDIRELCELVHPKYAIITGVGPQHLESFGSIEEISRTKYELAEAIPPDGFIVFNGDNIYTRMMSSSVTVPFVTAGYESGYYHAENVKLSAQGSKFDLVCGDERIAVETALLGRHNVLNVVLCAALARHLGISTDEIKVAVSELKPVKHRLEVRLEGTITVIDDGYNANIEGAACAYEVLKAFIGRKVVYTQGLVELGGSGRAMNRKIGNMAATVADVVILSGENARHIKEGLEEAGFKGEIHKFRGLREAEAAFKDILKSGDVLLIQNDIP